MAQEVKGWRMPQSAQVWTPGSAQVPQAWPRWEQKWAAKILAQWHFGSERLPARVTQGARQNWPGGRRHFGQGTSSAAR